MKPKYDGLHIVRQEQSRDDLLLMILQGDGFMAHLTINGKDTADILVFYVETVTRLKLGPGQKTLFHIQPRSPLPPDIKYGTFQLLFNPQLYCHELPPEMFEA